MLNPTPVHHQQRFISTLLSSWQRHHKQKSPPPAQIHRNTSSTPNPGPDNTNPPDLPTKATTKLRQQLQSITPHENIYTLPNILTFSRLLAAPLIGYFITTSNPIPALSLFFYAGLTDLIDGWVARRFHSQTVVGTVIDPMADKTLMTICVLALGYTGQFPWWLVVVIFGRDVALAISAIYFRWISLPPPKTMRRYWDFSLPSAEVRPTEISKINTLLQLLLVGDAMVLPVLPGMFVENWNLVGVLEGWEVLVAGTTVWSGLSYIGNKDAVKILTKEERDEKMEEMKGKGGKGGEKG
jgi:cardiolipin synthase (CMP-forming)